MIQVCNHDRKHSILVTCIFMLHNVMQIHKDLKWRPLVRLLQSSHKRAYPSLSFIINLEA